jgi:hypothetical protein
MGNWLCWKLHKQSRLQQFVLVSIQKGITKNRNQQMTELDSLTPNLPKLICGYPE